MSGERMALGVLLAAVAGVSEAQAQVSADSMVAGRPTRQVEFKAQGKVEYDTNIARSNEAGAIRQGVSPSDTIYSPSLIASAVMPVGQQAVFLQANASYLFHDKNKQLDHSRINAAGGLGGRLGPCGATVTGAYARGRSELEDRTLTSRVQNIATVKSLSVGATCIRPPGIGVLVNVQRDWGSNSLAITQMNNYETTSGTAGVIFGKPTTGSISLIGNYSKTEYNDRPTLTGETPGFETYGGGFRFQRNLGARIQGTATLTYSHVETLTALVAPPVPPGGTPLPDPQTEFNGLTYSAGVSFRVSSRLKTEATFDRRISPTLIGGKTYELQTNYTLRADYRIGSRFLVGVGAAQRESESRGGVSTDPTTLTDSRTRTVQGSLRYRQNDRLSFALNAQAERRKADNSDFNYNGERYGLAADFTF